MGVNQGNQLWSSLLFDLVGSRGGRKIGMGTVFGTRATHITVASRQKCRGKRRSTDGYFSEARLGQLVLREEVQVSYGLGIPPPIQVI